MQLRAPFARRADEHHREARVERHRDERRLAVTRNPLDAGGLRVHGAIRLEVVERARRAPRPRAQSAPVIGLARPTPVRETDDPFRETRAVVGLHGRGVQKDEPPSIEDELVRRRRIAAGWRGRWCESRPRAGGRRWKRLVECTRQRSGAKHDHHRHRSLRVGGKHQGQRDVHGDRGKRRIVGVSRELRADHASTADRARVGRRHGPRDLRCVLRDASDHLALEVLDDLRTTPRPEPRRRDALPVLQHEQGWKVRERVGLRLVIVGMIGRLLVPARPRAERGDAELLHHLPMVVRRRPVLRIDVRRLDRRIRRRRGGGRLLRVQRNDGRCDESECGARGTRRARARRPAVGERSDAEDSH